MRNYLKLIPYLKPHLLLLGLAAVCMVISSLLKGVQLSMIVPLLDQVVLDQSATLPAWLPAPVAAFASRFLALNPLSKLHWVVGVVVVLFILKNLFEFTQTVLMNDTALRFLRDIRNGLYRHYHRLSVGFLSGERTGELTSRITHDVSVLQNSITEGIADLVYQTSQVLIFTAVIFSIHWKLASITLILLPAISFPIVRIGKKLRKLGYLVQERMADLNVRIIETLQGIRIIKAFTAEDHEAGRFGSINQQYYKANIRTVKRREGLAAVTELIGIVGILFVLELGGRSVLQGELTLGFFVFFLAALVSLVPPFKKLSRLYGVHQQALAAAKRVVDILEATPSAEEAPDAARLAPFQSEVCLKDVRFRYDERFVLDGVNLTVRKGEVVALVGASGAGKTTLVNLVLRFFDPVEGRVTIDGVDLKSVTLESLRRQIGLVTQDPFLFHDTVRANIAFGEPNASLERVQKAAQAANADPFIQRLPSGYDTVVGEQGFKLSGGERQRLSIARALLKDPPILILDEATSQLDSESEALVQEALDRLMKNRTAFVIAHRLSTIRRADRIVVLDQGRVAETGRHDELLASSPIYRRLYELQVAP